MRPCHSFLSCERCSRNPPPGRRPVSPMYIFCISASYAIDDFAGGAREVMDRLGLDILLAL